jgi:hypothetical protein
MIAVLLRFMDSFMIYTEPFVLTGGGPGNVDHLPVDRPGEDGARAVRPWPGGGLVADVFPDHPADQLGVLHGDDQCRLDRTEGGPDDDQTAHVRANAP